MTCRQSTVLIVDDDRDMRWAMRNILLDAGFDVSETDGGGAGLEMAGHRKPAAVLLDMRIPGLSGEETLQGFKRLDPALPIIVVTGHGSIPGAVSAIRNGAFEYVTKPFRNDHLVETVRRAVGRRSVGLTAPISGVGAALVAAMGQGRAIRTLVAQVEAVVSTQYSVVISGETGAGKEVVARCLHDHGPRANHPLIVIDCGAIAETLTDSEFFGHEKGAFTGANERRRGCIESAAKGGTIFLDEVGNLAPTGQKALLRTLENRTLRRVGGTELIDLDMRVIAASNDDLKARAKTGAFREDLFFRLAEYVITVLPLRSRAEDIPFLAQRFLTQAREALKRPTAEIDPAAIDRLCSYRWPGNVRELRTVMRRAALIRSDRIAPADIADSLGDGDCAVHAHMAPDVCISLPQRIRGQVNAIERDAIVAALKQAMGNKAKAARLLGIDYKTYRTKLKMLGTEHEAAADEQG